MTTTYRLHHEGETLDVDVQAFQGMLPDEIRVELRQDGLYAVVASAVPEDDTTQPLVERELDRLFFLTCVRLRAEMCRRTVTADFRFSYRVHGGIPPGTAPLSWTDSLALQFRLWSIAVDNSDPIVRVLLFFQVIEISHPDMADKSVYPPYCDPTQPPQPRTEAKLLRHLVSHAGDSRPETSAYLSFLGLPPRLSNLTHPDWLAKVCDRLPVVESEARAILRNAP